MMSSEIKSCCQTTTHFKAILVFFILCVPYVIASYDIDYHGRDGLHVPCSFFDTVNVTGDVKFVNGSYLHENVLIPSHLVGVYNYVYMDVINRYEVEPHMRGCICKIKPCINFCCPWGSRYNASSNSCETTSDELIWPESTFNITLDNGRLRSVDIFQHFAVQNFRPCDAMYALIPEVQPSDAWVLFQNGTLMRSDDDAYLSKDEYCFIPTLANDSDIIIYINPANCYTDSDNTIMKIINAYAMLFSIPFMLLTIFVYLIIPELRNQHGKSLVCYLLGLCIGYSLLCYSSLAETMTISNVVCKVLGYAAYYFFMAAFFWLSVISFDLWHNFRGTRGINRFQEKKRYLLYSLYAWGLAAVFLVFTWFAQEMADIPEYLRPGIGANVCWLEVHTWSALIYFFGPIILLILANIIMFVMTALKIHHVQREMARIMAREDSTRNLRTEKDKFGLFLRLFIVMGVTWSMEIISYFVGTDKALSKIFYIPDICNAIQGFLIFMLFVMKKKVKHLITNRYNSACDSSNQRQSQYSTKTTSSSVANLSLTGTNAVEKPLVGQERTTSLRN